MNCLSFCPPICAPPSATSEMSPEICPCFHLVPFKAAAASSLSPLSVLNRRHTSPIVYSIVLSRHRQGMERGFPDAAFSITTHFYISKFWCIVFWRTSFDNTECLFAVMLYTITGSSENVGLKTT